MLNVKVSFTFSYSIAMTISCPALNTSLRGRLIALAQPSSVKTQVVDSLNAEISLVGYDSARLNSYVPDVGAVHLARKSSALALNAQVGNKIS